MSLYAVRVCARLAMQCSGIALMKGMEYAVDPNGDGDTSDAVDIVNLSIGTPYGTPFDHDLSQAINAATDLGVLVVASAGNAGDKPYSVATSSSARSALCVAQTEMPSASLQLLRVAGVDYRAVFMPWSPFLDSVVSGPGVLPILCLSCFAYLCFHRSDTLLCLALFPRESLSSQHSNLWRRQWREPEWLH